MNEIQKKIVVNLVGSVAVLAIKGSAQLIKAGVEKHKQNKMVKNLDREMMTLMTCDYLDVYPVVYMEDLEKN